MRIKDQSLPQDPSDGEGAKTDIKKGKPRKHKSPPQDPSDGEGLFIYAPPSAHDPSAGGTGRGHSQATHLRPMLSGGVQKRAKAHTPPRRQRPRSCNVMPFAPQGFTFSMFKIIPIWARAASNCTRAMALVIPSALCSAVGQYSISTFCVGSVRHS